MAPAQVDTLSLAPGALINFRVAGQLAPVGTVNATRGVVTSKTDFDGSNAATSDGINAARFDIRITGPVARPAAVPFDFDVLLRILHT
jgi:hypothetical protein